MDFECREKKREERFLQHHPSYCNPDGSADQMNTIQCIVAVGHKTRVISSNTRPTEREAMVKLQSEGDIQLVLATVPFSDRFYYSGSMKTRTWPVRSGFLQHGSLN
jgi:hypothetical protein